MEVVPKLTPTTLRALERGELAFVSTGAGPTLVIALGEKDEPKRAFCLIPTASSDPARLWLARPIDGSEPALTYGTGWVLEARPDASSEFGRSKVSELAGVLIFTEAGPLLKVEEPDRRFGDTMSINLRTAEVDEEYRRGWPTLDWKIWASEEDRRSPNGRPLFTCNVTPPQA